jgi:hypothetical protein
MDRDLLFVILFLNAEAVTARVRNRKPPSNAPTTQTMMSPGTPNPRRLSSIGEPAIRRPGVDHARWGTDSICYGSFKWQIESMHRFETPEPMRKQ